MLGNVAAMASRASDKRLPFRLARSQSFLFCFYLFILKAKSKRFGGLSKRAQAFKSNT